VLEVDGQPLQPQQHQAHHHREAIHDSPPTSGSDDQLNVESASRYRREMSAGCDHSDHTVQERVSRQFAVKNPHDEYSSLEHTARQCYHVCCVERSHIPMHRQLSPSHTWCYQVRHVFSVMQLLLPTPQNANIIIIIQIPSSYLVIKLTITYIVHTQWCRIQILLLTYLLTCTKYFVILNPLCCTTVTLIMSLFKYIIISVNHNIGAC